MTGALPGRRDRKKSETRQALRVAAHRLFAEQGFARTTIDDITEAADVSRRTFFRYYASKEDLLRLDVSDLLPTMAAALRSRPLEEPPLLSILAALRTLVASDHPMPLLESLAGPGGGVRARFGLVRMLAEWEDGITAVLVERWGPDPDGSLHGRATVTAAAATSALRSSVQLYRSQVEGPGLDPVRLLLMVERSFSLLAAGCPAPSGPVAGPL